MEEMHVNFSGSGYTMKLDHLPRLSHVQNSSIHSVWTKNSSGSAIHRWISSSKHLWGVTRLSGFLKATKLEWKELSLKFWYFKSTSRAVTIKPQQGPWSIIYMTMLQFGSHKNIKVTKPATIHQLLILRLIKKLFPPNKEEVAENLDSVVGFQELDISMMPWC